MARNIDINTLQYDEGTMIVGNACMHPNCPYFLVVRPDYEDHAKVK